MDNWKEIYHREFKSVEDNTWCIKIYDSNAPEGCESKEMSLSYETPILIEWNEVDKITPIQSSSMTLKVISEDDREYLGLYRIEPGTVKAEIYREGELYWSGMLDPELYEEPYAYKNGYEVQFTFSDFAILNRQKWEEHGPIKISALVNKIIGATGLSISSNTFGEFSTQADIKQKGWYSNFAQQYIIAENFYDEEGEAMTLHKVLEEILRPYGLSIVQKNGKAHVYDLNYLFNNAESNEIYWKGEDQLLGVDKVYNHIDITFSPFANTVISDGTIEHENIKGDASTMCIYKDYYETYETYDRIEGFYFYRTDNDDGLPIKLNTNQAVKLFRIDSVHSGSNESGVVWVWSEEPGNSYSALPHTNIDAIQALYNDKMKCTEPLITVEPGFVGSGKSWSEPSKQKIRLQIKLDMLVDVRYNPFESAGNYNHKDAYEYMQGHCNIGYVPVMLNIKDSAGTILYHYENNSVRKSDSYSHDSCKWVEGPGDWGCMWLCYYSKDDRIGTSCFGGWQTNSPIIGKYTGSLPKRWGVQESGELIEIPPCGGYLEFQIGRGIYQINCTKNGKDDGEDQDFYKKIRWLLYKNPTITVTDNNGKELEYNDIVYSSSLACHAEENLEMETLVGTATSNYETPLNARGYIVDENLDVITSFKRGGVEGCLEHLLIGSIYGQYGSRHETLSGTADLINDWCTLTDVSSPGKKFMLLNETQDILQETSEVKMSELSGDIYTPQIS